MATFRDVHDHREIRRIIARNTEDYDPDVRLVALLGAVWDLVNAADNPAFLLEVAIYVLRTGGRCGATESTESEYLANHPLCG